MSVDTNLDAAFNLLLQKAFKPDQAFTYKPTTINFMWSGGGLPLDIAMLDPILIEVPFPARLVWAHIYAGVALGVPVATDATIELRMTTLAGFGTTAPVYGTGLIPTLPTAAGIDLDITDWQLNFDTGDTLIAYVSTIDVATLATWLALTLQLRPTDVPIGVTDVLDESDLGITTEDGSLVILRA